MKLINIKINYQIMILSQMKKIGDEINKYKNKLSNNDFISNEKKK